MDLDLDAAGKEANKVGLAFVKWYYPRFYRNRGELVGLYHDGSCVSFEGQKFQGSAAIAGMLASLSYHWYHKVVAVDCQPSGPHGGVYVLINGEICKEHPIDFSQLSARSGKLYYRGYIRTGPEEQPIKFSQAFHLLPAGGTFFVQNEMFRLNYG